MSEIESAGSDFEHHIDGGTNAQNVLNEMERESKVEETLRYSEREYRRALDEIDRRTEVFQLPRDVGSFADHYVDVLAANSVSIPLRGFLDNVSVIHGVTGIVFALYGRQDAPDDLHVHAIEDRSHSITRNTERALAQSFHPLRRALRYQERPVSSGLFFERTDGETFMDAVSRLKEWLIAMHAEDPNVMVPSRLTLGEIREPK